MKMIMQFPLYSAHRIETHMGKILSIGFDPRYNSAVIWHESEPTTLRTLLQVYTGQEIPENATYLGTVIFPENGMAIHVYEKIQS